MRKIKPFPWNLIRHLSKLGIGSRREACEWVLAGQVEVNGRVVRDPGAQVRPADAVTVDGKSVRKKEKVYLLLHKPPGYITTRKDEKGRKTVYELLRNVPQWVFPVGRLDRDSEGLLLFTNDTAWGERMTNPACRVPRTYEVTVRSPLSPEEIHTISRGMDIGRGDKARPVRVRMLAKDPLLTVLEITLTEGKNREIRRMFQGLGKEILKLKRVRFGPYHLGRIPSGHYRIIREKEKMRLPIR